MVWYYHHRVVNVSTVVVASVTNCGSLSPSTQVLVDFQRYPPSQIDHMSRNDRHPGTSTSPSSNLPVQQHTKSPTARIRTPSLRPHAPPPNVNQDTDDTTWGSNFWVTLVDPQVCPEINFQDSVHGISHHRVRPHSLHVQLQAKSVGNPQSVLLCKPYLAHSSPL